MLNKELGNWKDFIEAVLLSTSRAACAGRKLKSNGDVEETVVY
ncbi:protein YpfM [Sodalis-like endosymbiont of Proechinophthirus fluctus]